VARWAVLLIALLLLSGCSGSSATPTAVTTHATAPATPSPSSSPEAAASPSAAPPSPTPVPLAAPGDVDGDGQADTVTVTATSVTVRLSGGGTVSAPIVEPDVPKPVVSGLQDLDRDGHAEIWVETARGASTSFVQVYRYDGTKLSELTFAGGHIRFGIGGSVTHGDGFACTDTGRLIVSTAESDDGTSYRVRTRTFRVSGATLVLVTDRNATAPSMDDPRVRAAYQVDCGPVGESD
jgi:hypothetical protein